jgi:hypothetical protein
MEGMKAPITPDSSIQNDRKDISLLTALAILCLILIYNFFVLSPAVRLGFVGDDFFDLATPGFESLDDIPDAVRHSLSRSTRMLSHGFFFIFGRAMWSLDPSTWHKAVLILGAVTICSLYAFLAVILKDRLAAIIGTGLFAMSGVIFIPQVWISGAGELMAATFICLSFLVHAVTLDGSLLKGRSPIVMDTISMVFLAFALISKETVILTIPVFFLMEFLVLQRLTRTSLVVLLIGGLALIPAIVRFAVIINMQKYGVTFNPLLLIGNLLAYFYDPLLASGGHYLLLDALGISGDMGALSEIFQVAREHLIISTVVILILIVVGILAVRLTLNPGRYLGKIPTNHQPMLPPAFGWLAWLILLFPALFSPSHHQAYYLTLPLAMLMVSVAPVFASGIRSNKFRIPALICLLVLIIWHPINSSISFDKSSVTRGAKASIQCIDSITALQPDIPPGSHILIDSNDNSFNRAIAFGKAFELYYPGTIGKTVWDMEIIIEILQSYEIMDLSKIIIFRKDNGEWNNVTSEYLGSSIED